MAKKEGKTYSKSALRRKGGYVLSTGGGEPIPEGKKWTTESRDPDAPRDEEGKFETKSSIGEKTKYPQHPWRGTYAKGSDMNPVGKNLSEDEKRDIWEENHKKDSRMLRDEHGGRGSGLRQQFAQRKVVKSGTKFAVDGDLFVLVKDMDPNDLVDAVRSYWKDDKGKGHFGSGEDELFMPKSGRRTGLESEALKRSQSAGVGKVVAVQDDQGRMEIANLNSKEIKNRISKMNAAYSGLKKRRPKANFVRPKASANPKPNPAPTPKPNPAPAPRQNAGADLTKRTQFTTPEAKTSQQRLDEIDVGEMMKDLF